MRKARFTEHQIIAVIKSVEAGRTVKDVCREAGISKAPTTTGSPDTVTWRLLILKRSRILRTINDVSNRCLLT
ncbi:transposase family protein [Salmonella enterica subsp. arizonae]|nr:transposase family protein [Salmonella enterica subsp. arizonae]